MPTQTELFSFRPPPIKKGRQEPRLWVKEFAVYRDYKEGALIRQLSLRTGLNIIWAQESETGVSGHAAGKSTFCRLLRYLMGDLTFGSDSFRQALREKMPDAVIAGEIMLDGDTWLVCRPLSQHGYHWCAHDHSLADLFSEKCTRRDYSYFHDAVRAAFIEPLGLTTYPGSDRKLEWQHLLQWLSRDQDARYADNLQWRPSSEGNIPLNYEKTNLVRLVLGHLEEEELRKQKSHNELLSERSELRTLLPKLQYARDRSVALLAKDFPKLGEPNIDLEFTLEEIGLSENRNLDALREEQRILNSHDGVGEVLAAKLDLCRDRKRGLETRMERVTTEVKRQKLRASYQRKELTKAEYKRQLASLGDIEGKCSALIELANEVGCPLAPALNRDELQKARIDELSTTVEQVQSFIASLERQKSSLQADIDAAEKERKEVADLVQSKKTDHGKAREAIGNAIEKSASRATTLTSALNDTVSIREMRERQQILDGEIKTSSEALAELRRGAGKRLSTLSEDFSSVASHLTQTEVHGSVAFHSDSIESTLAYAGDMSSAALVTLRLLIFDLACLLGSARNDGYHPGFLLHDSPREADLSAVIYRRLFTLIAERPENETVQYIIATTEPPPGELQKAPWLLCEPLSSASPESRFLRCVL